MTFARSDIHCTNVPHYFDSAAQICLRAITRRRRIPASLRISPEILRQADNAEASSHPSKRSTTVDAEDDDADSYFQPSAGSSKSGQYHDIQYFHSCFSATVSHIARYIDSFSSASLPLLGQRLSGMPCLFFDGQSKSRHFSFSSTRASSFHLSQRFSSSISDFAISFAKRQSAPPYTAQLASTFDIRLFHRLIPSSVLKQRMVNYEPGCRPLFII
jgi:hypothetical protein